jgi:hypothetical protein
MKRPTRTGSRAKRNNVIFNGPVSNCKSIELALVFGPGINEEGLHIVSRGFGVIVHAPTRRAVAAANPLVLVNCIEKLLSLVRVYLVSDGDEHGAIAGRGLDKHDGTWPVIPCIKSCARFRQRKGPTQEQAGSNSYGGSEEGIFQTGPFRRSAPKRAANRHAALKDEKTYSEDARADPAGIQALDQRVENRHEDRPSCAAEKKKRTTESRGHARVPPQRGRKRTQQLQPQPRTRRSRFFGSVGGARLRGRRWRQRSRVTTRPSHSVQCCRFCPVDRLRQCLEPLAGTSGCA